MSGAANAAQEPAEAPPSLPGRGVPDLAVHCKGCLCGQPPSKRKGPRRPKRDYENAEMFAMYRRLIVRLTTRVGHGDPEDLADMVDLERRLRAAVKDAGRMMLADDPERSFTDLGRATGVSRQAAWQRWGRPGTNGTPGDQPGVPEQLTDPRSQGGAMWTTREENVDGQRTRGQ